MSVSTNTGDAFLNSYARQINRLEKDPSATCEYDKAKQLAASKASSRLEEWRNGCLRHLYVFFFYQFG
jgi:hypothetical protein